MRKRINRNMLCSSKNYTLTKKLRKEYIIEVHKRNEQTLNNLPKTPYTRCFGKLVRIPQEKLEILSRTVEIIYL